MEPKIADSKVGRVGRAVRIAIVPLGLYGVLILWLLHDHHLHRDHLEDFLRSRARSVISTVEVGIANMGCKMRSQLPYLEACLRETVESESASGIALYRSGQELVKLGEGVQPFAPTLKVDELWTSDHLVIARQLRPGRCCQDDCEPGTEQPREPPASLASHLFHAPGSGVDEGGEPSRVNGAGQTPAARDPAGDLLVVAVRRAPIQNELQQSAQHADALGFVGLLMVVAVSLWRRHKGRATELETELLLTEERLKLTRERSLSAEGLAHETKNPLGMVRAMSQVLADDELGPSEVKDYAERITEEVDRTVARINEFLKYARPPSPQPETVSLESFFGKLQDLISEGNRELFTCAVHGCGLSVRADAGLLRQVLFNLLANAVEAVRSRKADEDGTYQGEISLSVEATGDQRCAIAVRDNGSGIAAKDLSQIFNPYFSKREDGSGLGLAIVKDICRSHGWSVEASSQQGRGATFVVSNVEIV